MANPGNANYEVVKENFALIAGGPNNITVDGNGDIHIPLTGVSQKVIDSKFVPLVHANEKIKRREKLSDNENAQLAAFDVALYGDSTPSVIPQRRGDGQIELLMPQKIEGEKSSICFGAGAFTHLATGVANFAENTKLAPPENGG